ncbi:hypothetical protein GCM10023085_52410 [Actinomadura viridis]|uniref:Uncharacterized protein n=1 Tax=Actinomadura viridis TaxID=58110 RepID=A0A931GMN7_9ACTN|nr:hypothetical protein [Actinomadura viridis]
MGWDILERLIGLGAGARPGWRGETAGIRGASAKVGSTTRCCEVGRWAPAGGRAADAAGEASVLWLGGALAALALVVAGAGAGARRGGPWRTLVRVFGSRREHRPRHRGYM